jgi:hypothetical protein
MKGCVTWIISNYLFTKYIYMLYYKYYVILCHIILYIYIYGRMYSQCCPNINSPYLDKRFVICPMLPWLALLTQLLEVCSHACLDVCKIMPFHPSSFLSFKTHKENVRSAVKKYCAMQASSLNSQDLSHSSQTTRNVVRCNIKCFQEQFINAK